MLLRAKQEMKVVYFHNFLIFYDVKMRLPTSDGLRPKSSTTRNSLVATHSLVATRPFPSCHVTSRLSTVYYSGWPPGIGKKALH